MLKIFKVYFFTILLLVSLSKTFCVGQDSIFGNRVELRLYPLDSSIYLEENKSIIICLEITPDEGWHFYWDALGLELVEPTISWGLPDGFKIKYIDSQEPKVYDYGGFKGYGFKDKTKFRFELINTNSFKEYSYSPNETLFINAKINTILCKDQCIFNSNSISLNLRQIEGSKYAVSNIALNQKDGLEIESISDIISSSNSIEAVLLNFGIVGWIILGLLGGFLLNFMPCVLPVLSIKLISIIDQCSADSFKRKVSGLMYCFGVLVSFIVLAFIVFALRNLGVALGWGFQLQNPYFVTFLVGLFLLLGLSMVGLYDFKGNIGMLFERFITPDQSYAIYAFLMGVVAALVGAPCIGPFIGAVSGVALQLDLLVGIILFSSIGLGMALPILLLSFFPILEKFLPKPGPWLEVFKKALGFLLIITAFYFIWVIAQSAGVLGLIIIILYVFSLVLVSIFSFIFGNINKKEKIRRKVKIIAFMLIMSAYIVSGNYLSYSYKIKKEPLLFNNPDIKEAKLNKDSWTNWSEVAVNNALQANQPVFIDYTASWCAICQSNKLFVLNRYKTQELFKKYQIKMFIADFTQPDVEISKSLESYGRNGVPLYLLLTPDGKSHILNQNLSYEYLEKTFNRILK